jgi:hypothetical protein
MHRQLLLRMYYCTLPRCHRRPHSSVPDVSRTYSSKVFAVTSMLGMLAVCTTFLFSFFLSRILTIILFLSLPRHSWPKIRPPHFPLLLPESRRLQPIATLLHYRCLTHPLRTVAAQHPSAFLIIRIHSPTPHLHFFSLPGSLLTTLSSRHHLTSGPPIPFHYATVR